MTEEQIIKGCLRKDVVCQRMLFRQYAGRLMTICQRYAGDKPEAEDILQESFIKIFNALHQYRFQGSFEGWMKKLVVNTCLKILQRKRITYTVISSLESISAPVHPHAISGLTEEELIKMVAELPDGYRIVFNLYVMEGFSHDEIAAMLNIETVTSRSQLVKARRMLQKQILSHQKIAVSHDR